MWFVIYRLGDKVRKLMFPKNCTYEKVISSFKGDIIDLFRNDNLTFKQFDSINYFGDLYDLKK